MGSRAGDVVAPQAAIDGQARRERHQRVRRRLVEAAVPERSPAVHRALLGRVEAGQLAQVGGEALAVRSPARRHAHQRVVAGDRAEQPGDRAAVEGRGDDVGAARWRTHDDDVAGHGDIGDPLAEHPAELLRRGDAIGLDRRQGVHGLPAGGADLDHAELVEIA